MKQGKRKNTAAEPAPAATQELPDVAYVNQLLGVESGAAHECANAAPSVVAGASSDTTCVVELPAQCLLRDAVEYRQRFVDCVAAESVTVDVGAVDRIDTAFIQVLLAFAQTRADAQRAVTWRNVTAEFIASTRLLGVQSVLSIPDVSEAA